MRGYLAGSGWKEYQQQRHGVRHRAAGRPAASRASCPSPSSRRPPRPRSAPTTRTSRSRRRRSCWAPSWPPRSATRRWPCTRFAADYAPRARHHHRRHQVRVRHRSTDKLILIDEVLTPDSSRFWPLDGYAPGNGPAQLRQAVRARLPRDPRLGQDGARPGAARRGGREDGREVPRGVAPRDARVTGGPPAPSGPGRDAAPGDPLGSARGRPLRGVPEAARYWQARYTSAGRVWGDDPSELARFTVARLRPLASPGLAVVDLGCGYGRDSIHLAAALGCRVHGIDPAPAAVAEATAAAPAGLHITFEAADAASLAAAVAPHLRRPLCLQRLPSAQAGRAPRVRRGRGAPRPPGRPAVPQHPGARRSPTLGCRRSGAR